MRDTENILVIFYVFFRLLCLCSVKMHGPSSIILFYLASQNQMIVNGYKKNM